MLEVGPMVWLGFNALVVLAALVSLVALLIRWNSAGETLLIFTVIAGAGSIVATLVTAFCFFPYNIKYYLWETKEGIIRTSVFDNKADNSSNNRWETGGLRVELQDGTVFYTTDFRVAAKNSGEKVSLVCKPSYQQGNVDRLDCHTQIGAM